MIHLLAQATDATQTVDFVGALLAKLGIPGTIIFLLVMGLRRLILWSKPHLENCFVAFQNRQERIAVSHETMANKTIEIQSEGMSVHRANAETLKRNTDMLERLERQLPTVCQQDSKRKGLGG